MPTAIETITSVEDQVIDVMKSVQEPVTDIVSKLAEYVAGVLPDELPELPFADQVPTATDIVENNFAFAKRLLETQHQFAKALLKAAAPVLREQPKAKPAAKTTVKAA